MEPAASCQRHNKHRIVVEGNDKRTLCLEYRNSFLVLDVRMIVNLR